MLRYPACCSCSAQVGRECSGRSSLQRRCRDRVNVRILRIRCSEPALAKAPRIAGGKSAGLPRLARGRAPPLTPCRTGMPALRAAVARVPTGMLVSAVMSLRLRCRTWYCSFSRCGSISRSGRGASCRSRLLTRSCRMRRSLQPVMRAILRGPNPCRVSSRAARCREGLVRRGLCRGVRLQVSRVDVVGVRSGPADAGDPVEGLFPGDGFVDAGVAQQVACLAVEEAAHLLGHGDGELGVVGAAAFG
jgi:hypothetical protein